MKIVSFICTGNICRSVLGHYIFQKYLYDRDIENIEVRSYGMKANAGGEKSPKFILSELESLGIYVNPLSRKLDKSILESDLCVCFVNSHIQKLKDFGCKNVKNIKDLCSKIPESCAGGVSVPDPYFDKSVTHDIAILCENSCENILVGLNWWKK